jgi:hypothetical protein
MPDEQKACEHWLLMLGHMTEKDWKLPHSLAFYYLTTVMGNPPAAWGLGPLHGYGVAFGADASCGSAWTYSAVFALRNQLAHSRFTDADSFVDASMLQSIASLGQLFDATFPKARHVIRDEPLVKAGPSKKLPAKTGASNHKKPKQEMSPAFVVAFDKMASFH